MSAFAELLMNHGVVVVFILVLAEQVGLPVPGAPMLLAVGSLASLGRMNLTAPVSVALVACLIADLSWYEVGRRRRSNLLAERAKLSIGSEVRLHFIEAAVNRCGLGALVMAKFLPGPNLASPLAGISGLTRSRFLVFDSVASIVWSGGYITAGYIFNKQLQHIIPPSSRFEVALFLVIACAFVAAAVVRSILRRRHRLSVWQRAKNSSRRSAIACSGPLVALGTNGDESL
jgi:membrane protein DedA with SNARE-associated domain